MTMELKEAGLAVGKRRVGRLMKANGIKPVRTRRHKVTTDSHHRLAVAANWLDGDFVAAAPIRYRFPWLCHIFADGGSAGDKLRQTLKGHGNWTLEISKRSDAAKDFVLLPRRWVVERTSAWLGRCRLAKYWERSIKSSTAWATIASICMFARRSTNH